MRQLLKLHDSRTGNEISYLNIGNVVLQLARTNVFWTAFVNTDSFSNYNNNSKVVNAGWVFLKTPLSKRSNNRQSFRETFAKE